MKTWLLTALLGALWCTGGRAADTQSLHPHLKLVQIERDCWLHISWLRYGNAWVPCNGLVVMDRGEAVVVDTPVSDSLSWLLLNWVHQQKATVKHLVASHHHVDCLGGLAPFINTGAQTWSHKRCCALAKADGFECTQRYFTDTLTLPFGRRRAEVYYPGAGHAPDNVVTYFPYRQLLFGGCLVKALGADVGNIADADLGQWPMTINAVKTRYAKVRTVVPGHGAPGTKKLLKYTEQLLAEKSR